MCETCVMTNIEGSTIKITTMNISEEKMPLLFLSLKELAMRAVLQEEVSFEDLPPPLRKELVKLSNFHGGYKLIEPGSEKFTKTGGGAPTPEEIDRIKSHHLYRVLPLPPPTLSISKASKTSAHLWLVENSTNTHFVRLFNRNVTHTLPSGNHWESSTEFRDGDVTFKSIFFKRSISSSGGGTPSIIYELEILFEMEDDNKVMKLTVKSIFHEVDPDIECSQSYVFQRN